MNDYQFNTVSTEILMTEAIPKLHNKLSEEYTNKLFKNFYILTNRDKIQIRESYNPDSRSKYIYEYFLIYFS